MQKAFYSLLPVVSTERFCIIFQCFVGVDPLGKHKVIQKAATAERLIEKECLFGCQVTFNAFCIFIVLWYPIFCRHQERLLSLPKHCCFSF
jgi:hypothetical protein